MSTLQLLSPTEHEDVVLGRPQTTALRVARRTLDVVGALVMLVAVAPVLLAVTIAIRLESPGGVVFRQRRVGRHGRTFVLFKFRSMFSGADASRHRDYVTDLIAAGADAGGNRSQRLYKLAVDDRVTRVGSFIRAWSLDELPQLFNVLRGEMSLVGPRPVIEYELETYPDWYHARFAVKPGITGLWQVSGRNERTYEEMVRLDIEYAERQSLALDLKILARTVVCVLTRRGAA